MAKRKRFENVFLLVPGEQVCGAVDCYQIERLIGMGAFAAVYAARDPSRPARKVALKEFYPARHPREQQDLQALFDRERTVGKLASPHPLMPAFYEGFVRDGHFYIAQEFIEGSTLDEIIAKRHPLPRDWILKWSVSLCDALAFLHSRQVIHHDLKPANIRITPQGHLTLLDFGAARYFGVGHEKSDPGEIYGTEGYLPPEVGEDGQLAADVRTDIFAVGCIIYEMIAGVAPDQESINERSLYVTNTLINRPNADLHLVKLINRALSYNTEYRYGSANEFLLDMRKIAPPILLISRKHLDWGEVVPGQTPPVQYVTLYNAGGGEIRGEIKPRAPWINVNAKVFRGNRREVPVKLDLARIGERNRLITGQLEINMADQTDDEGNINNSGDRWFVECSVLVKPRPGYLEIRERAAPDAPPIPLSGRKGQPAVGTFEMRNLGELPLEFRIGPGTPSTPDSRPMPNLTAMPDAGTLAPQQSLVVRLEVPTVDLPPGNLGSAAAIRTGVGQTLSVPLAVRVLSALDYLKSMISRR